MLKSDFLLKFFSFAGFSGWTLHDQRRAFAATLAAHLIPLGFQRGAPVDAI